MKMKLLLVLSASLLVSSCTTTGIVGAQNCVVHQPPVDCTDTPVSPAVTLNLTTMKANPPNVCAGPGETITIKLVPEPAEVGTVAVVPKNFADTWLIGTNSPDKGKIEIEVPAWVPTITNHDYGFVTSTGDCADPRVHVK